MNDKLALIGFGEAGSTFAAAGRWVGARGWDVAAGRREAMAACGVKACMSAAEALDGVSIALSLVTADKALEAARDFAHAPASGAIWCDMNSVAPDTKREAAQIVEAAGGRYVDVAVLAPVNPGRLGVLLLLSGKAAAEAMTALAQLGFTNLRIVGEEVGRASAIKMIRSIMVKGVEALTAEMMLAAEEAGVAGEVLASLDASERSMTWAERSDYNLERMAVHGLRRAAEMEEVVKTLIALGVEPLMTRGTVVRERAMAGRKLNGKDAS